MDIWSLARMLGPQLPAHSRSVDMSGYGVNIDDGKAPDPLDMSGYGMAVQPTSDTLNDTKKGLLAMFQGLKKTANTPVMTPFPSPTRTPVQVDMIPELDLQRTPGGMGDVKRLDDPKVSAMPGGAAAPTPEAPPAPTPEQAIMAKLQGLQGSQIGAQKDAVKKLEAELEKFKGEGEVNLQPLTALVDAWSGSNFTGSYKQPMSHEEKRIKEFALQDMVQKQRRGIADDEMNMLKLQLAEKLGAAKAQKAAAGARLPSSAIEKFGDAQMAVGLAGGLENTILENSKLMGPAKGMGALLPYSAEQKKLVAEFNLIKQKIGKAIEGGVLRKEDESKYEKILPVITDLPDVAIDKARRLNKLLSGEVNRFLDNYGNAGYNVKHLRPGANGIAPADTELSEGLKWLEENPDHPLAAQVKAELGV